MKKICTPLVVAALAVAVTTPLRACDSCALYLAEGGSLPGFSLSLAHQFTRLGSVWQGDRHLGNPVDQYLDSAITQASVAYTVNERLQVQATLPYIDRRFRRPDHALIETGRVAGVGDATLAALYRVGQWRRDADGEFTLHLLGGIKFATGDAGHLGDEIGHHLHHHANFPDSGVHGHDLALGTGATDGIIGANAAWRHRRWFARAALQYKLRRPGAFDYRMADETAWELSAGTHLVVTHAHTLALAALFAAEHKGLDTLAGDEQEDTGISVRYLGARVSGTLGQQLSAEAAVEVPVRIRTSETMVVPDYRVRAGFTWRF